MSLEKKNPKTNNNKTTQQQTLFEKVIFSDYFNLTTMTEYYGHFENLISYCNHLFDEQEKKYIILIVFSQKSDNR